MFGEEDRVCFVSEVHFTLRRRDGAAISESFRDRRRSHVRPGGELAL
jgi:hypothetical protein